MKKLILSLGFILLLISKSLGLSIGEIYLFKGSAKEILLSFNLKEFPIQEVILSLKRQKEEVLLLCEVEIYRERFFLRDELVQKYVFFKKGGYKPEINKYYLEDGKSFVYFDHPEELSKFLIEFQSLDLSIPSLENKNDYYLLIKVQLSFYTHLDSNLRYTSKVRQVFYKTEKKYDFSKSILY